MAATCFPVTYMKKYLSHLWISKLILNVDGPQWRYRRCGLFNIFTQMV